MNHMAPSSGFDGYDHRLYHPNFDPALHQQGLHPMQQPYHLPVQPRQHKPKRCSGESPEYFLQLTWDPESKKVSVGCSSALKDCKDEILEDLPRRFGKYMKEHSRQRNYGTHGQKLKRTNSRHQRIQTDSPEQQGFSNRKRKVVTDIDDSDIDSCKEQAETSPYQQDKWASHQVSDELYWKKWFSDAFTAVQQVSCRIIAKEWIKTIHPKKQSTHPYNGKDLRTGVKGDPSSTRPHWWPEDVIHKEPDHINKAHRTKLLVHLIMQTPIKEVAVAGSPRSDKEITAKDLKEALDQKKEDRQMVDLRRKYKIIENIIYVRTQMERCNEGGINRDTMVAHLDFSSSRVEKNEDDDEIIKDNATDILDNLDDEEIKPDMENARADVSMTTSFRRSPEVAITRSVSDRKSSVSNKKKGSLSANNAVTTATIRVRAAQPRRHENSESQVMDYDLGDMMISPTAGSGMQHIPAGWHDNRTPSMYNMYPNWQSPMDMQPQSLDQSMLCRTSMETNHNFIDPNFCGLPVAGNYVGAAPPPPPPPPVFMQQQDVPHHMYNDMSHTTSMMNGMPCTMDYNTARAAPINHQQQLMRAFAP